MGAAGEATVIAINDCPPIEPGSGTVVTGKFVHQCAPGTKLVHLRIAGQSEPTGVTDNHPYWSVDRHDFIPAGELRVGELVDTEFGAKRVQSVEFWTGFDGLLYNLETTEHVFRVGCRFCTCVTGGNSIMSLPDPATWRALHLQMRKDAGGSLTAKSSQSPPFLIGGGGCPCDSLRPRRWHRPAGEPHRLAITRPSRCAVQRIEMDRANQPSHGRNSKFRIV